jgi:NitT/TauT family transport system substrate-binding protein
VIRLVRWLVLAGAGVAIACGPAAAPPGSSATVGAAPIASTGPALASLVVSWNSVSADQVPVWMAAEAGLFAKQALDVDVRYIAGPTSMAALLSGETQLAHIGGAEALSAIAGGADLVVIAVPGPVYPYLFYVPGAVRTPADLKGQKVGVTGVGSSTDIATRVGLPRVGIIPDTDVTLVSVGSISNLTAALLNGAVAGGMGHQPDSAVLEAKGFHALFDLASQHLPFANNVIAVQRSYLVAHRDVVQRYVDAIVAAIAREKSDKSYTITVMKKYFASTDDAAMGATWEYYAKLVRPELPYARSEQFTDLVAELAKRNDAVRQLDLTKILDPSFVQSAADRGVARP